MSRMPGPSPPPPPPTKSAAEPAPAASAHWVRSDGPFLATMTVLAGSYVLLIVLALAADFAFVIPTPGDFDRVLSSPEIQYATRLSLVSSCVTTILSLWVAIPIGYLMSRHRFRGKLLLDAILDIPVVLPPLVIGVSLLILFQMPPGTWIERAFIEVTDAFFGLLRGAFGLTLHRPTGFTYAIPGVILAQFMVSAAFAVRTMRTAFDEISPRKEQVALTLGCTRGQAFWHVVLPEARGGIVAAATLTWARAIGEFGPILVFAGATPRRTEVLPTSVFLLMSNSDLKGAVAVSLIMVALAVIVLVLVRLIGHRDLTGHILQS
jgi:molybdate transport system permease protein